MNGTLVTAKRTIQLGIVFGRTVEFTHVGD
jgi:hypothetical protein